MIKTKFRLMCLVLLAVAALQSPAQAKSDGALYLETIGGFGGSYIYLSYAYIGATADAYAKNIYPASQVKTMMEEKVSMIKHLAEMLHQVQNTNIEENDKQFVASMLDILDLLRQEAESLAAFAESNNPSDVERYEDARKKAWPKIKKLLGIN